MHKSSHKIITSTILHERYGEKYLSDIYKLLIAGKLRGKVQTVLTFFADINDLVPLTTTYSTHETEKESGHHFNVLFKNTVTDSSISRIGQGFVSSRVQQFQD